MNNPSKEMVRGSYNDRVHRLQRLVEMSSLENDIGNAYATVGAGDLVARCFFSRMPEEWRGDGLLQDVKTLVERGGLVVYLFPSQAQAERITNLPLNPNPAVNEGACIRVFLRFRENLERLGVAADTIASKTAIVRVNCSPFFMPNHEYFLFRYRVVDRFHELRRYRGQQYSGWAAGLFPVGSLFGSDDRREYSFKAFLSLNSKATEAFRGAVRDATEAELCAATEEDKLSQRQALENASKIIFG